MIHHLKIILILLLMIVPVSLLADQFYVIRVYDGDTITGVENGKEIKVHLLGIETQELSNKKHLPGQPFSLTVKGHIVTLVLDKVVTVRLHGGLSIFTNLALDLGEIST